MTQKLAELDQLKLRLTHAERVVQELEFRVAEQAERAKRGPWTPGPFTREIAVSFGPLVDLPASRLVEQALLRVPGVHAVALSELEGDRAIFRVAAAPHVALVEGLRQTLRVAFDLRSATEDTVVLDLIAPSPGVPYRPPAPTRELLAPTKAPPETTAEPLDAPEVALPEAPAPESGAEVAPAPEAPEAPQATPAPEAAPAPAVTPAPQPRVAPSRKQLGSLLMESGNLTAEALQQALEIQERAGDRLGRILTHEGLVGEAQLAAALAAQLDVPVVEVDPDRIDRSIRGLVPRELMLRLRAVPVERDGDRLVVAMADPFDKEAITALTEHTGLRLRRRLATETDIDLALQALTAPDDVDAAATELAKRKPEESAARVLSTGQRNFLIALVVVSLICLVINPIKTIVAFNLASVIFYAAFSIYRFRLVYNAVGHNLELPVSKAEVAALDEHTLPVYTVLVPLYHEAAVLPRLLVSLAALDYPASKLDIKVLVEEDDDETIAMFHHLDPPPCFRLVVVPDGEPKTKPKACNYGLRHAHGELVVIYDAEDRPDRDQLKKVVAGFRKAGKNVACIQCKLNYYNREQNLLTRWFTTEYSMWFDIYMPGLDASDAPIPLGGTSNHFATDKLIDLGAWDPFNVAEDADLGIRLSKSGMRTAIIDSTTYEEANSELGNWIRQRSRWVKGYVQTWLVHMRSPIKLLRQLGLRRWLSFQLTVGGTFIGFLMNPIYWALSTLWILTEAEVIRTIFPSFIYFAAGTSLILGNFVFAYVAAAGSMRRGYFSLVKYALLSPIYWGLMSIGAWKGFIQLFTKPFYWEKTVHGLDEDK